jgi:hypothetical protein
MKRIIIESDEDNLTRGAKGLVNESKSLIAEFGGPQTLLWTSNSFNRVFKQNGGGK